MTTTVELPNGVRLEFPDGMVQADMAAAIAASFPEFAAPAVADPQNADGTYGQAPEGMFVDPRTGAMTSREMLGAASEMSDSKGMALAGGVMQGLSFGFGDEIMGGIGYLQGGADMANLRREQARGILEAQREAYPVQSIGGEVVGSVGTGIGLAARLGLNAATRLGGWAGRAVEGMKIGALEGGLMGAGNAEEGERLAGASTGAGLGAVTGGAAPYVMAGARAAVDPVAGVVASMRGAANPVRASRAVSSAVERSGRSAEDIQAEISAALARGQPYTIADATGNAGQRMLSGVARSPGDARQEIAEFLTNRQTDQGRRISGALDEGLNDPQNVGRTAEQVRTGLTSDRRYAARTAYDAAAANARPVDVNGVVSQLDANIAQMSGSGIEPTRVVKEFQSLRNKLAGQTENGDPTTLSDYNSVRTLWQEVRDDVDKAYRNGDGSLGEALKPIRDELEASIAAASDEFRDANRAYREASGVIGAIDDGAAMTSPRARVADNAGAYAAMTPAQQAAARAGYVDPLIGRIENAAPGVNNARPLLSQGSQAELAMMARDPQALNDFIRREQTMFETGSTALGGSRTADNLADIQEVGALDASLIANALTGRWASAAQQLGVSGINAATGRNTATRDQIAQLLLSTDVAAALTPAAHRVAQNVAQDRIAQSFIRSLERQASRD